MPSAADHLVLAEALHACRSAVVLSGYPSALYDRLYADWHRLELAGFASQASAGRRRRTEVLWCNRDPGWLLDVFPAPVTDTPDHPGTAGPRPDEPRGS
jgi:hypothetical protein